jgi:uncharacterized protein YndB with AHSA1/START domain
MTTSYTLAGVIGARPDAVYAALTQEAALRDWLAESAEVALARGTFDFWGRFTPDGERGRKRLLAFAPGRALSFSWLFQDTPTEVAITLAPAGVDQTEIRLTHTNVPPRPTDYSAWVRDYWLMSLANLANFAEGRRTAPKCDFAALAAVPERDRDGHGVARGEVEIDALPERVFASLIEPAQLDRWIATKAEVEPVVGGRFSFGWDHGPVKIVELVPDKVLAYSWEDTDAPGTVVRWELAGSGGHTYLTLVHSGFGPDQAPDGYQLGWQEFLVSLRRMHEIGEAWQPFTQLPA